MIETKARMTLARMTMAEFKGNTMKTANQQDHHYKMTPFGPVLFRLLPWGVMINAQSNNVFVVVNNVRYVFIFRCVDDGYNTIQGDNDARMYRHFSMSRGAHERATPTVTAKTMATLVPYAQEAWDGNQENILSQRRMLAEQKRCKAEHDVKQALNAVDICKEKLRLLQKENECGQ